MSEGSIEPYKPDTPALPTYRPVDLEIDEVTAARLAEAVPPNTRLAYEEVQRQFEQWCAERGRVAMPATDATFADYVSDLITRERAPATISQHIGAIRTLHRVRGYKGRPDTEAPLQLLRGYRRQRAEDGEGEDRAPPILPKALRAMIDTLDLAKVIGRRDQLLLVLGFTLMARRSELTALRIGDVVETEDGLEVTIRTSKTDKDSRGAIVPLPPSSHPDVDPVRLARAWKALLADRGMTEGPLLRVVTRHSTIGGPLKPATVNNIVQRIAIAAHLPNAEDYSAHSLRAGGLTAALKAGIPLGVAAAHGRWSAKSPVVIGYARAADRWRDNAMRGVL